MYDLLASVGMVFGSKAPGRAGRVDGAGPDVRGGAGVEVASANVVARRAHPTDKTLDRFITKLRTNCATRPNNPGLRSTSDPAWWAMFARPITNRASHAMPTPA